MSRAKNLTAEEQRQWVCLGKSQDLPGPGPHAVNAGRRDLVVVQTAGELRCFSGRCPHQGTLLGEGRLEDGQLVCRNHGWRFDEEGRRVGGPQCLERFPLEVKHEELWVQVPASSDSEAPVSESGVHDVASNTHAVKSLKDLPHPRGLPIVGNGHQIVPHLLHRKLESWADELGCPFRVDLLFDHIVCFDAPDAVDQVLRQRPDVFRRLETIEPLTRELQTYGVFSAEGTEWRSQRRLAMAALAQRNLQAFYSTLRLVATRLLEHWKRAADDERELDLLREVMLFTVDVTSTLAFGRDTNTIEQPDDRIQQHLQHILPTLQRRMVSMVPYWRFVRLPRDRRVDRSLAVMKEWIGRLIRETRDQLEEHPELREKPQNLLQAMLMSRNERDEPFDEEIIRGNVMTMLLAGEDTTAGAIAWLVHEALEVPHVIQRLTEEADTVLGDAPLPQTPEQANDFEYLVHAANEALRLRPPGPINTLTTLQDTVVDGVHLPPGTHVDLLLRRISTSPDYVTDPASFRPERWQDPKAVAELKRRGVHVPFGSGPRLCPGRGLALLEMRVVLGMLFHNFSVERVGSADQVQETMNFTMAPQGLRVRLKPR